MHSEGQALALQLKERSTQGEGQALALRLKERSTQGEGQGSRALRLKGESC